MLEKIRTACSIITTLVSITGLLLLLHYHGAL
jgi:hypothetical protein